MTIFKSILNNDENTQRNRRFFVLLIHGLLGGVAYTLAIAFRFEWINHYLTGSPQEALYFNLWVQTLPLAILVRIATIYYFRLHRGLWRYASINDLVLLLKSVTLGTIVLIVTVLYLHGHEFPRTVFINDWLLTMAFFGGLRFFRRVYAEVMYPMAKNIGCEKRKALIVGAGDNGEMAVRALLNDFKGQFYVIGFVDDDPSKQGARIHDIPVLGTLDETNELAVEFKITDVVFAIPNPNKKLLRDIVNACSQLNVRFLIMPTFNDMLSGNLVRQEIRNVELDDLLGRDPINLDRELVNSHLRGRDVMITGAGGSIGSELTRQVAACEPRRILLLEFAENALFEINQELINSYSELEIEPLIGDIKDEKVVDYFFKEYKPEVVYHAAAYKHVPLMEGSPLQCIANNVFGTLNLVRAARKYETERFVMISTDKAVRPVNIMGASKRLAEILVASRQESRRTKFISVRFGNVLGSSGSVIPTFRKQIARGGPVTVTHSEITRYFITIPEAVELVLQSGVIGKGGEVFVLDMGEPVKIMDLARNMIELSGLRVNEDIKIECTGLRPGEKMYEELVAYGEEVKQTEVPKLMLHNPSSAENISRSLIDDELCELNKAVSEWDYEKSIKLLWSIICNHDQDLPKNTTDKVD